MILATKDQDKNNVEAKIIPSINRAAMLRVLVNVDLFDDQIHYRG